MPSPSPETKVAQSHMLPWLKTFGFSAIASLIQGEASAQQDSSVDNMKADLRLGGELRERVEYLDGVALGANSDDAQTIALTRLLLRGDAKLTSNVRLFLEVGVWEEEGREKSLPTDISAADVSQAFIELSGAFSGGKGKLLAGRQELSYGSSRMVSVRDGANMRRAFDALRVRWTKAELGAEAFVARPIRNRAGAFDDVSTADETLWGLYVTTSPVAVSGISADAYILGLDRHRGRIADSVARERRRSLGLRVFGDRDGWDWDMEAVYQSGSFGPQDISAWTVSADVGVRGGDQGDIRVGLKLDIASGDSDATDGVIETFNALYPKLPYFSEASLVAPANLQDIHPNVSFHIAQDVLIEVGADFLWRHRETDAFYRPSLEAIAPVDDERFTGWQPQMILSWQAGPQLEIRAWVVNFLPAKALRNAGVSNAASSGLAVTLRR